MKGIHRWTVVSLFVAGLVGVAGAQDWPQWRGPKRDGKAAGFKAPAKWPAALTQKWKTTVGLGCSTPALVGDRLFVFARQGNEEVLLCLGAADGKEIWKKGYEAAKVGGPASSHPGPRSSPAVADGKVVTFGVGGVLICRSADDGKELWRKEELKAVPRFFTSMSPVIAEGMCIAQLGGEGNGGIFAFDLATGAEKWKWTGEGAAYSSPVIATIEGTETVLAMTEKSLVGLALAGGKLLFQTAAVPQRRTYNAPTPIVDGSTIYISGQGTGTKALKVEKSGDGFAIKDAWSTDKFGTGFNTPVLKDGLLFGCSDRGNFFCLKCQDGATAWNDGSKRDNFCAIVDAGSCILALPAGSSELTAFKPSDKGYEELAEITVSDTPVYAHPVAAGNRIIVKDKESVILYTVD